MSGFTSGMRSSASDEWTTPKWLFDELDSEFHFTLDAASTHENALCEMHYTAEDDALSKSWDGETVWLNPPYGRAIGEFMRKASEISGGGMLCLPRPRPHRDEMVQGARRRQGERDPLPPRQAQVRGRQELGPFPELHRHFRRQAQEMVGRSWIGR